MDANDLYDALCVLCDDIRHKARAGFQAAAMSVKSDFNRQGTLVSSGCVLTIYDLAAMRFEAAADLILTEVLRVQGAGLADAVVLISTYESRLRALAGDLRGEQEVAVRHARSLLRGDWLVDKVESALDRSLSRGIARIRIAQAAQVRSHSDNRETMTINNYGQIGAAVIGDRNTINGQQATRVHVTPADALAAIDVLLSALAAADRLSSHQRRDSTEVLEHLKVEAAKERPNKSLVGGLLAGVRDVVGLLDAAPGAWETLRNWSDSLF